jgi:CDP-glucose 4,6-dehydratase
MVSALPWTPDFWRGRRVWLSGHTGFKGSWLALWLLHWGAVVEGYALDPEAPSGISTRPLYTELGLQQELALDQRGDLADLALLSARLQAFRPEVVFHLAAQPLVQRSYREPLLTWSTNVIGTCHVLEALRQLDHPCVAVMITTDKVYDNREWDYGYREEDPLGGHDPYSSSKGAAELAIASWRSSFCGTLPHQCPGLRIASARAGNVIGGGDWAENRIVPDAIRALIAGASIAVRSPASSRPWQHVLEPLGGYLLLAERLHAQQDGVDTAFNFGPDRQANQPVSHLIEEILQHWPGRWEDHSDPQARHEASRLDLSTDRAFHRLDWRPRWNFTATVAETVAWYRSFHRGESARDLCLKQIKSYLGS